MAAHYVPVSTHDHHLAAAPNEVDTQHKEQQLSATQLPSLNIDDSESGSGPSQADEATTVHRPSHLSTRYTPATSHPAPSSPMQKSLMSILYNCWLWELTTLFISTVALAAVIVLLIYWDEQPLSQWPSSISLNTFVSTLGTVHKSGLALFIGACLGQQKWNWFNKHTDRLEVLETFDEASRGPWGSTKLIYQLLPRWNLSHLACLVLLISLTFDAFLQATISLHECMDLTTSLYNIPRIGRSTDVGIGSLPKYTMTFTEFYSAVNNTSIQADYYTAYPSMGLISAIFNGLDDSSAAQEDKVDFSCQTGNCTWPVFTSAAICSTCNDVSKYILSTTAHGFPSSQPPVSDSINITETYTRYNLSYNSIANPSGRKDKDAATSDVPTDQYDSILTANGTTDYLESLSFYDANTTFLIFLIMAADPSWTNGSIDWENSSPTATECGLSLCVNAYNSSVQSGNLSEEKVASWQHREYDSWRLTDGYPGYGGIYEWWDETYPSLSDSYNLFRSDLQLSIPSTDLAQDLGIDTTERFNITQGTIASIQDWLVTWGFGVGESEMFKTGTPGIIVYPINAQNTHVLAEVLHTSTDLNSTFAGLASSITNYIRDSSNTTFQGDAHDYVIKFRVRWPFLTVPALHILGGMTYVLAIVWQTKQSGLPVWKTRLIPSLAYGFDTAAQDKLRSQSGCLDIASDSVRSRMIVTLDTDGSRPQLRLSESTGHDEGSVQK
ncbi:hypothetical protein PV11_10067 [Exophiala sideris]|uniref:Uncharacterized protein n=1 Tax=Exophiala sideris TaxID=1016849 RepID=A0A0D1Y651_9EURO|nr:hypothetical protein PV11_10067 [Exophiala sideris]